MEGIIAILVYNKINFQPELIKKGQEGHFILIKLKIYQAGISIVKIYATNTRASTFVKETLLKRILSIKSHTLIVKDFNTPLPSINRPYRKIEWKIMKLTDIMNQTDLIDIYRTFHTNQKNMSSSQHLMKPEKLAIKLVTKQASTDIRKLK